RWRVVAAGLGAIASKEAAAVVGALLLVDAAARGAVSKRVLMNAALLLGAGVAFAAARAPGHLEATASFKFMLQKATFEAFGALSAPWHLEIITAHRTLVAAFGVVLTMVAVAGAWSGGRRTGVILLGASAWAFTSFLPMLPFLYVGPDLQGSRYL